MTSYRVTRTVPRRPRQYIRRIVCHHPLWTDDATLAQRFSAVDAAFWQYLSQWRTEDHPQARASERPGEYSTEAIE